MQDQLPTHPNDEGLWQLGLCRGGLEGEANLCVTPVVNQALPREVPMHVSRPVQLLSLQVKSTQVIQLFCDINVGNVLVYPIAYCSRRRSGIKNITCNQTFNEEIDKNLLAHMHSIN